MRAVGPRPESSSSSRCTSSTFSSGPRGSCGDRSTSSRSTVSVTTRSYERAPVADRTPSSGGSWFGWGSSSTSAQKTDSVSKETLLASSKGEIKASPETKCKETIIEPVLTKTSVVQKTEAVAQPVISKTESAPASSSGGSWFSWGRSSSSTSSDAKAEKAVTTSSSDSEPKTAQRASFWGGFFPPDFVPHPHIPPGHPSPDMPTDILKGPPTGLHIPGDPKNPKDKGVHFDA